MQDDISKSGLDSSGKGNIGSGRKIKTLKIGKNIPKTQDQ